MVDDDTSTSVDMTQDDATQAARNEHTESETSVDVDLVDDETREEWDRIEEQDRTRDDVQHPELRKAIDEAEKIAGDLDDEDDGSDASVTTSAGSASADAQAEQPSGPSDDAEPQRVQVDEGTDPMNAIESAGKQSESESEVPGGDGGRREQINNDDDGLMADVDDDELADAMDMELNIREDIDPQHFDYENQDFSHFGGYGSEVTIEYNDTLFLLVQPGDDEQEELINNMGGGVGGGGFSMSEMMEAMMEATVARPTNIEQVTAEWTPFERMGLGLQCMEFLGIDALGNM